MSRPPAHGRAGPYGQTGTYGQASGSRGPAPYVSTHQGPGGRMPAYGAGATSSEMLGNMPNMNMSSHYGSNPQGMGQNQMQPPGMTNMNISTGMTNSVSSTRPTIANIWDNRPPEDVRPLSEALGAPDYFPFLRTAPEENMRPPIIDQGYSEPFIAGEENEYGTMRDKFADPRQIQDYKSLIDQGLKTLTLRRQMMSRRSDVTPRGPQIRKRPFPPISTGIQQDKDGKNPFWEKLANLDVRLAVLSTQQDAIKDPNPGKWDQYIRSFCDANVPFDRATWYIKVWHLNKMYAQQSAAIRAQRDATANWTKTISGFIIAQIRDYYKKVGNKSGKSSAGEKSKLYVLYATRLLYWTYVEGIVAPDTLFESFLTHLLTLAEPNSTASAAPTVSAAAGAKPPSTTATSSPTTPEIELWYLGILMPYSRDICLTQSTLRMLYRYCMGRMEQLVPSKYLSAWSSAAAGATSTSPTLSAVHAKIYSICCSLLRVIVTYASDFVVVQNSSDIVLDRIADRDLILSHVVMNAPSSSNGSSPRESSSLKASTGGESSSGPTTLHGPDPALTKALSLLIPKPTPFEIDQAFREPALETRRKAVLLRTMSSPQPNTKLKIIDLLDTWNRFSDMKSFCDAVLDTAQGRLNSNSSSGSTKPTQANMTPAELVNLICDWVMSPHRALRDIYPPFVASALLKRLRNTPDWTYRPSEQAASAQVKAAPQASKMPPAVAATPIQALFMPSTPQESPPPLPSTTAAKRKAPNVDVASLLLNYLDNMVPMASAHAGSESDRDFFARMSHLFGELTRCNLFSHDKYMRSLISRGLMDRPASAEDDRSRRHRRILEELPIFGDNSRDRMQRRMLLYGTGAGILPTDESISAPAVALIEPWILGFLNSKPSTSIVSTEALLNSLQALPLYHQVLVTDKLVSRVKQLLDIDAETPITSASMTGATELLRHTICVLEAQGDLIFLLSFVIWILQDAVFGCEHVALFYVYKYEKLFVCAEQLVDLLQALHDRYDEMETIANASNASVPLNPSQEQIDKTIALLVSRHSKVEIVEAWKTNSVTNLAIKKRFTEKPMRVTFRANKPAAPDFEKELAKWLESSALASTDVVAKLVSANSMLAPLYSAIFKAILSRRQHIDNDRSVFTPLIALVIDLRRRFGSDPALAQAVSDALQLVVTGHQGDDNAVRTLIYFTSQLVASATLPFDQLVTSSAARLRDSRDALKTSLQNSGNLSHLTILWHVRVLFDWICLMSCGLEHSRLPKSMKSLIGPEEAAALSSSASALLGTSFQPATAAAPSSNQQPAANANPPSLLDHVFCILQFIHVATAYTTAFSSGAEEIIQEYLLGDALDLSCTFVREVVFASPANAVYNYVMNLKDPPGSYSLFYRHLLGRSPDLCTQQTASSSVSSTLQETLKSCFVEAQTILSRTTEWNVRQSWLELQLVLDCGIFTEKPQSRTDVKTLQWFSRLLMEAVACKRAPAGPVLERIVSFLVPQAQSDILALLQEVFDDKSVLDGSFSLSDAIRSAGRRVWAITSPGAPLTPGGPSDALDESTLAETLLNIISQLSITSLSDSRKRQMIEKTSTQLEYILNFLNSNAVPRSAMVERWPDIRRQVYLRCALLRRFLLHSKESNLHLHLSLPPGVTETLLQSLLKLLLHPVIQSTSIDTLDLRSSILYAVDAFMGESAQQSGPLAEDKNQGGPRTILLRMDDSFLRTQLASNSLLRARLEQVVPTLERREGLVFSAQSKERAWMLNKVSNPSGAASVPAGGSSVPSKLDPWLHLLETESEPFIHGDVNAATATVPSLRMFNVRVAGPRKELTYAKGLFDEQERIHRQQRQKMQHTAGSITQSVRQQPNQPGSQLPPPQPQHQRPAVPIKEEKPQLLPQQPHTARPSPPPPAGPPRTYPTLPNSAQSNASLPPPQRAFPTPNVPASRPPSMSGPPHPSAYGYPQPPSNNYPRHPGPPPQYGVGPVVQLPQIPQNVRRQHDPQFDAEMGDITGYYAGQQDPQKRGF